MRINFFSFLLLLIVGVSSCKKSDVKSNTDEECFTTNSLSNGAVIEGQYIISYRSFDNLPSTSALRIAQVSKDVLQQNGIDASALRTSFSGDLCGFVANLTPEQAQRIKTSGVVETIEPDRIIALGSCFTVVAPSLVTWNVKKVGYGDGTGKTAWIMDTGIDSDHPDLTVDVARSKSFLPGNTSIEDENGHGTHVAGIIGGKNNTIGVLGVASGANLVSIRILDKEGVGTLSSTIQALAHISANAKAGDVVNMSFGEEGISEALDRQVKAIAAKGVFFTMQPATMAKLPIYFPRHGPTVLIYSQFLQWTAWTTLQAFPILEMMW